MNELVRRTLAETVALHQRVMDGDLRPVLEAALTGRDGGAVRRAAAVHVSVPSEVTARVQEVHRTLLHVICDLVERAI